MGGLRGLVTDRLVRNSVALMVMTAVTSLCGLLFWTIAAHHYSTSYVGRTAAIVAAGNVLAILAQLNLAAVLTRFLPTAADKTRRLVKFSYLATLALCVVFVMLFLAADLGEPYLQGSPNFEILLALVTVLLLLGSLQDSVVIALRKPGVVLIENCLVAVARLAIVVPLAAHLPATGMAVANVIPAAVAVPLVGLYIFRRQIPAHERDSSGPSQLPSRRRIVSFVGAEYTKSIVSTGTTLCLPLIVAATLGVEATAYFTLPWLINISLNLFLTNISTAYVVEAGFGGARSLALFRRAMILGLVIVVGGAVAMIVGAPLILHIVGARYADQGTTLMRLLGLALPFSASILVYSLFTWLNQRVWWLVVFESVYSVLLLGLSPILLTRYGLPGAGWAFLIAEGVFGIACIPPALRHVRRFRESASTAAGAGSSWEPSLTGG